MNEKLRFYKCSVADAAELAQVIWNFLDPETQFWHGFKTDQRTGRDGRTMMRQTEDSRLFMIQCDKADVKITSRGH